MSFRTCSVLGVLAALGIPAYAQTPGSRVAPSAAAVELSAERLAAEREFWASVKESKDPADLRAYLEQFPNGTFEALVRNRLKRLEEAAQPKAPQATVAPGAPTQDAARVPSPTPKSVEEALGLTPTQRVLVQRGLTSLGFDVGEADGILGARSRAGIREWQSSRGGAATGYLNAGALETLLKIGEAVVPAPRRSVVRAAMELLTEALTTAQSIRDEFFRAQALSSIAKTQASAGDIEVASTTARSIERASNRVEALSGIAKAQAIAGDTRGAAQTVAEALNIARSIKRASNRVDALSGIAEAQAVTGDTRGAAQTISEALTTARNVQRDLTRVGMLNAIAKAQAIAGDTRVAEQTISEALKIARRAQRGFLRGQALNDIVGAQASAGDIEVALTTARTIEYAPSRALALSAIAKAQASAGNIRGAAQTVSATLAVVQSIKELFQRGPALRGIAGAQAVSGDIQAALITARSIENAYNRGWALRSIAEAQASAGDLDVALTTARSIEDAYQRALALGDITKAQLDGADGHSEPDGAAAERATVNSDSTTAALTYESKNMETKSGGGTWGGFLYGYGSVGNYYALAWNAESSEAAFTNLTKACRQKTGFACWPRHLRDDIWFPDRIVLFSSGASKNVITERDHVFQVRARCGLVYEDNCPYCRYNLITGTSAKDVEAQYEQRVAEDREYYGENYSPDQHRKMLQRCNDS